MKVLAANIEDVFREAAARWTLVTYFLLSTMFVLIFAAAVNLDVVDGALAGAKLFGKDVHVNDSVSIENVVTVFESGFASTLYYLSTLLAVFATAHLVPRMQEKGTIDLYLSRPVARAKLLFSRYAAGLLLAASNIVYLLGAMWLIILWKTHVAHPRFLLAGAIILLVTAALLAFSFLVGVVTSSTAVSIMMTYGIYLFSALLVPYRKYAAAVSYEWEAFLIKALYWVIPKAASLGVAAGAFVSGSGKLPTELQRMLTIGPFLSTALFAAGCLALAAWLFQRKEF